MIRQTLFVLFLALAFVAGASAQEAKRTDVPEMSISFIQPSFLEVEAANPGVFHARAGEYGGRAIFLFGAPISFSEMTEKQITDTEVSLKTADVQKYIADKYAQGMVSSGLESYTIEKTEFRLLKSLPTIAATIAGKSGVQQIKSTVFAVFSRPRKKMYYVALICGDKYFDDFSKALQPAIDSIEFK